MTNGTTLFFALALATLSAFSQTCPSDLLNDSLMTHDMEFSRSFFYMERMLGINSNIHPSQRSEEVYNIPVVVHVIHKGEAYGSGSNITDEQVFSAIAALNEDFRRAPGTHGYGNGVDAGIEFCLASRNPNGQPTNGIVRVNGSGVSNYASMGIEASSGVGAVEESVKALSTWPRESYMNIWVVNEIENNDGGSGIQGYAYFPVNSPIDGIVVLHNSFGTVGNLKSYTNMNRTLTHEVGHYLGLYHTFNSTTTCTSEMNCSTQGDRVCDTPPTIQAGNCSAPACGGAQQVENYMDYTPQTCQNMFTDGQKLRMRTTLEAQRASLLNSMGCMPVFQNDIGITSVVSPIGTNCGGNLTPKVTLANFGGVELNSAFIQYSIDGVGAASFNWTGALAAGASIVVELPLINATAGNHTFFAWTMSPNGGADDNAANNQSTADFVVTNGAAAELDVVLDYFGYETSWIITNGNAEILMSGGPYTNGQQGLHMTTPVCLATGCYTLTMNDAYGDGQAFTNGSYTLKAADGSVLAQGAGDWGAEANNNFCIVNIPQGNAPVAAFTVAENIVCANTENNFYYSGTEAAASFNWTFEGGFPATSSVENPQGIVYANAGSYDVTLTVSNEFGSDTFVCENCVVVNTIAAVIDANDATCFGLNNGSAMALVQGGSSPFQFQWSNGSNEEFVEGLAAGNVALDVTDANGCSAHAEVVIEQPTMLTVNVIVTGMETCVGNDGSAEINIAGGIPSYTILWNNGNNEQALDHAPAGIYTVAVSDANGCTINAAAEILYNCQTALPATQLTYEFCGADNLELNTNVECEEVEGADQYMFRVSTPSGIILLDKFSNDVFFSLNNITGIDFNTSYVIMVRARVNESWSPFGNACQISTRAEETSTSVIEGNIDVIEFNLYPNPCDGNAINFTWSNNSNTSNHLVVSVVDAAGKLILSEQLAAASGMQTIQLENKLSNGFYVVSVQSATQRIEKKLIVQ
ncbi:MAG: M43 family zinc metalloprotease [Flavobacteriales bacterium]